MVHEDVFSLRTGFLGGQLSPVKQAGGVGVGKMLQEGGKIAPIAEAGVGIVPRDFAVDLGDVSVESVLAGIVPRVGEADNDHVFLVFLVK